MINLPKNKLQKAELLKYNEELTGDITTENIKNILCDSSDVKFRTININRNEKMPVTLVYINGLVDNKNISDFIAKPLMEYNVKITGDVVEYVEKNIIYYNSQSTILTEISKVVNEIMNGNVAIVFDAEKKALSFDVKGFDRRAISEPSGESVVKGARDTFTEVMAVNTATLRRKIRTHNLSIEQMTLGKQSLTTISVVYLRNIANPDIVEEVKKRLLKINVDSIIGSGFIEESIVDNRYSIVPQINYTERPDTLAQYLVDGFVGILIEGIPTAIITPTTLNSLLKSPDDYDHNYVVASGIRALRYLCILISSFLPALFVALTTFHQEMIPPKLAIAMQHSKEGVPLPTIFEILFMLLAFEILLEGGLRLPRNIGQTISIVGALVIGQSAVAASFVSPAVVIIIALTGISGFVMPNQDFSNALRIIRFVTIIFSAAMGLFGIAFIMIIIGIHLSSIECFGVPYLSPYVGNEQKEMHDTFFRSPLNFFKFRESFLKPINIQRQKNNGETE